MGGRLLMQAHRTGIRLRLKPNEKLVFNEIAYTAKDADLPPRYFARRDRLEGETGLSPSRAREALTGLLKAGAIVRAQRGMPGKNATFTPLFTPEANAEAARAYVEELELSRKARPESGHHSDRNPGTIQTGIRAPEESPSGIPLKESNETAAPRGAVAPTTRRASTSGRISSSQLALYRDTFIICYRQAPSAAHLDAVKAMTQEDFQKAYNKVQRGGHEEFRYYGEIEHDRVRESTIDDGTYDLLSDYGRERLDARAARSAAAFQAEFMADVLPALKGLPE